MLELTINGQVYAFNFGMGFMREINKTINMPVDGAPNVKKNVGLRYAVAGIIDGDIEDLVNVLDVANKGQSMRITRDALDAHIDNPNTDIDALFEKVLDFLRSANATKKVVESILEQVEEQKAKAGA